MSRASLRYLLLFESFDMQERTVTYFIVQHRQPPSLEELATVKIGDWVACVTKSHLRDTGEKEAFVTETIEKIRNILECNAPRDSHDKLFLEGVRALTSLKEETEEMDNNVSDTIEQMTGALFTKYVKSIRLDVNESIFYSSLCFKSYLLTGLTHLEIYSHKIGRKEDEAKVIQILKGLPNLKQFSCCRHPFSTANILKCLADNCKFIEDLDVSHNNVNEKDFEIITELSDLKILNLNYTYVSPALTGNILQSCKKLEHIYIDTLTIERAMEEIKSKDASKDTKFNLKVFNDCVNSSYEKFKLFVSMCPKIETAYLTDYSRGPEYLSPLYHLNHLNELELLGFDFYGDKVKELLEFSGHNIFVLRLPGIGHLNLKALRHIGETCPKLETLSVDELIPNVELEPFDMLSLQLALSNDPIFKRLKKLNFQNDNFQSSKGLIEELMFLLCNSPIIEDIYTWVPITDDIMLTILDRNPLVYLRELTVYENQLTEPVIEKITDNNMWKHLP